MATTGWPEGGDLKASAHVYDEAVDVDCGRRRSMRRAAVCALAEMSNYRPLLTRMVEAGLFDTVPQMLRDSLPRWVGWEVAGRQAGNHPYQLALRGRLRRLRRQMQRPCLPCCLATHRNAWASFLSCC